MTQPDYPDWIPGQAGVMIETQMFSGQVAPGWQDVFTATPYQTIICATYPGAGAGVSLLFEWLDATGINLIASQQWDTIYGNDTISLTVKGPILRVTNKSATVQPTVILYASNRPQQIDYDTRSRATNIDQWTQPSQALTVGAVYTLTQSDGAVKHQGLVYVTFRIPTSTVVKGNFLCTAYDNGTQYQQEFTDTAAMRTVGSGQKIQILAAVPANQYIWQFQCTTAGTSELDVHTVQA